MYPCPIGRKEYGGGYLESGHLAVPVPGTEPEGVDSRDEVGII